MSSAPLYGEVVTTERLTPQLVRVVLGGAGLEGFVASTDTDAYVNAFFRPDGAAYGVRSRTTPYASCPGSSGPTRGATRSAAGMLRCDG